jgi:NIPSNAP.
MIYHCIRYTIDPQKAADFETYARRWMEGGIIRRCGGEPLGYFLPKKGYGGADQYRDDADRVRKPGGL